MSSFIRNKSCEMCHKIEVGLTEMTVGNTKHYLCYPCMAIFATDVLEYANMNLTKHTDESGNIYFTDKDLGGFEMTNEQAITRVKHSSMYIDDRETADYIIKALEQHPCEDCVSREQAVKAIGTDIQLNLEGRKGLLKYSNEIKDILKALLDNQEKKIKALSPVTPTHGTCENCKYLLKEDIFSFCCRANYRRIDNQKFYCGNYEKREGEIVEMTREIWEERKNPPIDGKTDF